MTAAAPALLLLLVAAPAEGLREDVHEAYAAHRVRDRLLWGNTAGRAVTDFYYRHSLVGVTLLGGDRDRQVRRYDDRHGLKALCAIGALFLFPPAWPLGLLLVLVPAGRAIRKRWGGKAAAVAVALPLALLAGIGAWAVSPPEHDPRTLFARLDPERSAGTRAEAAHALVLCARPEDAARLRPLVAGGRRDPDPRVRLWIGSLLGILRDRESVDILCAALDDPEPLVRSHAAEALHAIGDPRAIPPLEARFEREPHPYVRRQIAFAHASLGGTR